MNKEENDFMQQQEEMIAAAQSQQQQAQSQQQQQSLMMENQERNIVKEQLDLGNELELIENLLRGNIIKERKDGSRYWAKPDDPEMIILSEHGIHLVMNTITFYINKNTLLSNYDEETISKKMEDFATDLADTVFMEYEKVFEYPTFEDCKNVLNGRIDKKKELRKYANELVGKKESDEAIIQELRGELEGRIEDEIQKIKEQIIKNKLKRFLILIRTVQDAVHSTYQRAWKGQERTTLRQHIHVSENINPQRNQFQQSQPSKLNPANWFRG